MRPFNKSTLLLAGFGLIAVSHPAYAQDVDDEIISTGIRQAYQGDFAPIEIPQANQIIDETLLRDVGAINLNDALDLSSSVARQNSFGGLWNSFSIRGFSGDINLPSLFLVNGFNAGRGFGGPRDLVGVESVEILKGPRSALYGRGEPGGTINLVTKRPELTTGGYVQGTIGSWEQYRIEGDFQTVLGDGAGIRLVGFFDDAESFRQEKETQKYGFYPSLRFDFGDSSTLTYELEYTSQELPQDRGVIFSETFGFSPIEIFTGEPDALLEAEVLGHQLEFQHEFNDNWSLLLGAGYRETSLVGDAYENNFGSRQPYFVDGRFISRFFRFRDYEADYISLRAEVSGEFETGGLRHRLIAGVDWDEFENDQVATRFRQAGISGQPGSALDPETYLLIDLENPQYGLYARPDAAPQLDRVETTGGFGFYIQDQIDLTDRLQIRIGGRFDDFDQELINRRATPFSTEESSNSAFSPQIGAVYEASDGISLYASYGEGIRQLSGTDLDGNSFDPNSSSSGEFGLKADFGTLFDGIQGQATIAAFQVDQSNILVFDTRPGAVAFSDTIPAGEARSRGFEVDVNAVTENDFRVWLSYSYIDAEYLNEFTDAATFTTFEAGEPLINSPDHQFSVQAVKGFEVADMDAELGGGLLYVAERSGEVGADFDLPSYTSVRLFGQIEPVENVALRLDIDNLFDEDIYTDSFADVWVQPGAPRRFRFTARYEF